MIRRSQKRCRRFAFNDITNDFNSSPSKKRRLSQWNVRMSLDPNHCMENDLHLHDVTYSIPFPTIKSMKELSGYEWDIYLSQLENEKKNFHEIARENSGIDFEKLRRILISWMIEVQVEFKLQAQSLFLAVNYVDRMLHIISTPTVALQLLGATSLFIAAKYEEIYPPNIEKFLFICDNMYSKQQMLSMEYQIINSLSFDLTSATIINFISLYLKVLGIDENYQEIYFLCYYLGELTLPIIEFRKFLPSKIAASIVCFAVYIYQNPNRDIKSWIKEFENIVQYKKEELLDCIHLLRNNIQNPGGGPNFVVQKFSEPEYGCIAEKIPKRNLSFC